MNETNTWVTWTPIILSIIAIFVAILSYYSAKKATDEASRFGAVNAERQWRETENEYFFEDEKIREWEESRNLERDGIVPKSNRELEKELNHLNVPQDIQDAYRRRWRTWNSLREMSHAYEPFHPRFISIDLSFPSHPAFPAGKLKEITGISINELPCEFAGIRAPCTTLIKSGELIIPEELFGPKGMFAFSEQIRIEFPLSIHETPSGLVVDTIFYGKNENPLVKIIKNKWDISDPSLHYQYDIRRLEVIGNDGIPIFRIHLNNVDKIIHIGGRFITKSGKAIACFPEKTVTDSFVFEGIELRQGSLFIKSMRKIKQHEILNELRKLTPWFYHNRLNE